MYWLVIISPYGAPNGVAVGKSENMRGAIMENIKLNMAGIACMLIMPN